MTKMRQHGCNGQILPDDIILPQAPMRRKVRVIDQYGDPLEGAHVQSSTFSGITNQFGIVFLESSGNENFTFSHIGKETRVFSFHQLSGVDVVLEDQIENLEEVIITDTPKRNYGWLWFAIAFGTGYLILKNKKQPKKVSL